MFSSYGEHEENQLSEMKRSLIYSLGTWCSILLIGLLNVAKASCVN